MTYEEYLQWVAYRQLRGSLALHRRLEQSVAGISHLVVSGLGMKKLNGMKFSMADFLPHENQIEPDDEGSEEFDLAATLRAFE